MNTISPLEATQRTSGILSSTATQGANRKSHGRGGQPIWLMALWTGRMVCGSGREAVDLRHHGLGDPGATETLSYRGLFNGAEYQPTGESATGGRNIHAEIWVVCDVPLPERS